MAADRASRAGSKASTDPQREDYVLTRRLIALAIGLIVAGAAWVAVTGLIARSDSHFLTDNLSKLEADLASGDTAAAQHLALFMQEKADGAHARTTGPAWWLASKLPYLGKPAASIRAQAVLLDDLATTAMPAALRAGEALNPRLLRTARDSIDLARLQAAVPTLDLAAKAAAAVRLKSRDLPGETWLAAANRSRASLLGEVNDLDRALGELATAAHLLPEPLGLHGVKRYFVAFETDAEARGLGGLPGAYAILRADHGQVRFTRFGSDQDLLGARSHLDLGTDFADRYDSQFGPQKIFQNSDSSPDFPAAAQIWMGMWEDKFHQHLDGAVATDPAALGYLLSAVGPVTLADGTIINSDDSVRFFENAVYLAFPSYDLAPRKAFQVLASRAVASQILDQPSQDLVASATQLQRAATEGHLLVYVADPDVERSLANTSLGGVLPRTRRPFLDVIVNNTSGTKLDYYLGRTITYSRSSCDASGVTVKVDLHNFAPDHDLPDSVLGRAPGIRPEPVIGEEGLLLSVYGTAGASIEDATINGKPSYLQTDSEKGHPIASVHLSILPGQSLSVVFRFDDPAAGGPLLVLKQPTVRPTRTVVEAGASCSSSHS